LQQTATSLCEVLIAERFALPELVRIIGVLRADSPGDGSTGQAPPMAGARYKIQSLDAYEAFLRRLVSLVIPALPGDAETLDPYRATQRALAELPRGTAITREIVQRIGQDRFRAGLITYWQGRCAVTGLDCLALLRASHIKPWAACESDQERLDVYNGLLLAPHLDAAFDGGWISFTAAGQVLVSTALSKANQQRLGLSDILHLTKLDQRHIAYLRYHRRYVFQP
jgi:hypothetical protein